MPSPVSIHWGSLAPDQTEFVRSALIELSERLAARYKDLPQIKPCELLADELTHLTSFLNRQDVPASARISETPLDNKLVFVYCSEDYEFAKMARKNNPMAQWGVAVRRAYALAWMPNNKYLVWHEAMHLLVAKDCYDDNGQTTCDESRCIMQYVATRENCGDDLYLCSKNQRIVATNWP